ncbi:MAG: hypothetical protein AAF266_13090 [Planctomycetota bacterium]
MTKKAATTVQRRLRRACKTVRSEWTAREQRQRRLEAFHMQSRLANVLGLQPEPVRVPR